MSDQPISQEIKLPTDVSELMKATAKLDELIGRVGKLEHASTQHHESSQKHQHQNESGFKSLWETMGRVVKREAELMVGIRAIGVAGLEAKNRVGEFMEFIGAEAALEGLKKIGEEVIDIGKETVKSAAMAERMNFAIDAVSGGKEGGENVRKWVEANAKFSEFSEAQNESAYTGLRHKGVGQDKAGLYMKAAEDIAAVSAPEERTSVYQQTLEALARVHSQGRISARGAMQLGITVDDLKSQPGFKGLSNEKVWQKAEKANLDENTIMALIMRHTGEKAIGEKAADASGLLLTKMSKLAGLPELFYKRLGESATTKKLTQEIDVILEKLDPGSPTGRKIFGALESAFESIANAVHEFDFESLADSLRDDVIPAVKEMVAEIGPALHAVETTVHGLGEAARFIRGTAAPGKQRAVAETDYQKNLLVADDANAGFLTKLLAAAKSPFLRIHAGIDQGGLPGEAKKAGEAVAAGYAQGIGAGAFHSDDAAMSMGESSHASLMESIDAHSPSRKFAKVGGFAAEGYAIGIEHGSDGIDDAMASTFQIPASGFASAALPSRLLRGETNLTVTVNVAAAHGQDETGLGQAIAAAVRREVTDLLDRTGDE